MRGVRKDARAPAANVKQTAKGAGARLALPAWQVQGGVRHVIERSGRMELREKFEFQQQRLRCQETSSMSSAVPGVLTLARAECATRLRLGSNEY